VNATPHRNRNFRRDVFDSAVDGLGLNITPHNLRDTAAAPAIQAGAAVGAVAHPLGHESAATTLNHYAGLSRPTSTTPPNALARRPVRPSRDSRFIKAIAQRPRYVRMQSAPGKSAPGRIRTCDTGFRRAA
jgi:integrase